MSDADPAPDGYRCEKCGHEMERGSIESGLRTDWLPLLWVPGGRGKRPLLRREARDPADRPIPVAVFRCMNCGYLEMFSRDQFG